mmetsp:Transcript_530/g.1248  ORF Transcript_530/g.1248 Transcript_530/m.1248 type:complete len:383 (-) Transcript_530:3626-4774(-)
MKKNLSLFEDINLSTPTTKALEKLGYRQMTNIQKICIPPALKGNDILGSARTGSGKTLCFVVPTVEKLWYKKWTDSDFIGGCIICPIRELGVQVFALTKTISSCHFLTSQIFIGGKQFKEKKRKKDFSILVTTPSSLIKEIFSKNIFGLDSLQIISIDEIDKLLDLGFYRVFSLILKIIPKKIQTLAFSATLTKKVKNITRLNLKAPIFCRVGKNEKKDFPFKKIENFPETTTKIFQFYVKIPSEEKFNILFSFIQSHKKKKMIIFLSTRKQINFFSQILKNFSPHVFWYQVYGNMNQKKRIENIISFNESQGGILLSTDLISRGMDFRFVDWIIQADCPHDVETYLHRTGRTGRFFEKGKSLLIVCHQETFFLKTLTKKLT